jgi:hypothetical protein
MRIIKRGQIPELVVHTFTCTNCKSVIEALGSECTSSSDPREGQILKIQCPVCYKEIYK